MAPTELYALNHQPSVILPSYFCLLTFLCASAAQPLPEAPQLQAERLKWDRLGDNDDNWHYTFGLEENSGWIGHNGMIYIHLRGLQPELDATIVIAMNSDKKVNGEQGINVLLRDISKILFPNNPVNVPVIK